MSTNTVVAQCGHGWRGRGFVRLRRELLERAVIRARREGAPCGNLACRVRQSGHAASYHGRSYW